MTKAFLALNAGSSSIKFALFEEGAALKRHVSGALDRIGAGDATLTFSQGGDGASTEQLGQLDRKAASRHLAGWIDTHFGLASIAAVGHRLVHGGPHHSQPTLLTPALVGELRQIVSFAPEHLPAAIELIEHFAVEAPELPQIACFDTSFHWDMPRVAKLLPIPRRYEAKGVRRYGFHGLSYSYLIQELARVAGAEHAAGRVVLAHLGNGASLAAVRGGKSIDTSMGFTPAAGIPMGSRSGDVDPGLVLYLAQTEQTSAVAFNAMVNHESGLLGVSETSADMRDLLLREADDPRAAEAIALFCYQAKKVIGGYAAALGGLETLVFSGGIGEHAWPVRARICDGLEFLGVAIDPLRNRANAPLISADGARVAVRVIPTDEELMVAEATSMVLARSGPMTSQG
jgi:acetate kinase